jgi:hypothetical protein
MINAEGGKLDAARIRVSSGSAQHGRKFLQVRLHASRHSAFVMCVAAPKIPCNRPSLAAAAGALGSRPRAPDERQGTGPGCRSRSFRPWKTASAAAAERAIAGAWGAGEPTRMAELDVLGVTGPPVARCL